VFAMKSFIVTIGENVVYWPRFNRC